MIISISCWLLALAWLWQAVAALRGIPTLPDLTQLNEPHASSLDAVPLSTPEISVIVPACNEEGSIEATLHSLLASTNVRMQIVAIDDRSTDRTGERMEALAAKTLRTGSPHTLEVICNRELPARWLGKTHALALGVAQANAPWLLFTDGDVRFDPRAVALALRYSQAERADHVVLGLSLDFEGGFEQAVFAAFQALAGWSNRLWKVADPDAWDFFGAGGFNMVRREVYERVGGVEALRMEVIEDLRMGWKIKRAGFASHVVLGPGLARIHWIKGALGIVGLLEKNGFAAMRYRVGLTLLGSIGFVVQIVLPLLAIPMGGWAAVAGVLTYFCIGLAFLANRRVTQVSPWLAALFAPATAILLFALLRSMVLTLYRGGVVWRGTKYPLDELRRHAGSWGRGG
jgi:glycosyltransferase involved in cell wall biosynthesis